MRMQFKSRTMRNLLMIRIEQIFVAFIAILLDLPKKVFDIKAAEGTRSKREIEIVWSLNARSSVSRCPA
jgi:hypothetical protein